MSNEILSYREMCNRENINALQRGMNFRIGGDYSIVLMSTRDNAPYHDVLQDNGATLIYEGHNEPRSVRCSSPKEVNQPEYTLSGTLTQNGKFHRAAQRFEAGLQPAELVRVYEKIHEGIWSYNGAFHLVGSWLQTVGNRNVFKFKLVVAQAVTTGTTQKVLPLRSRVIPTEVKLEVWKRDKGQCVKCGASDELHFDHILPYAKGGTSVTVENVQILCARHNLAKSDKII